MTVTTTQNIVPFLWYDGQAEAAAKLYTSIFPNSGIVQLNYWGENSGFPANWVRTCTIMIDGLKVYLFDAGPQFKFNESCSLFVHCKTQAEIDRYWSALTANGGQESQCGWCKDPFGFSWQIVPEILTRVVVEGKEPARIGKVMAAMMKMKKMDVAELEAAYNS